jgi:acyl-CoA reductase-like NAD-dependent aldehyde dehydrogenase
VIKRVELELGGNSPFVVLEDADLEQTVEAAVFGRFLHQGQICRIANRLIIHDRLYEGFADAVRRPGETAESRRPGRSGHDDWSGHQPTAVGSSSGASTKHASPALASWSAGRPKVG